LGQECNRLQITIIIIIKQQSNSIYEPEIELSHSYMNKRIISCLFVPTLTFLGIVAAQADPPQASPPTANSPDAWSEARFGINYRFAGALLGSWQVIYNVPAFVIPIPILLTFSGPDGLAGAFGEVIENR
jgi:hypothetical protein